MATAFLGLGCRRVNESIMNAEEKKSPGKVENAILDE